MKRIPCLFDCHGCADGGLVFAAVPVNLTAAQTPAADHEQHHPGTPDAAAAANDPCVAGVATPAAGMPQTGMMMGTPAMEGGTWPA